MVDSSSLYQHAGVWVWVAANRVHAVIDFANTTRTVGVVVQKKKTTKLRQRFSRIIRALAESALILVTLEI